MEKEGKRVSVPTKGITKNLTNEELDNKKLELRRIRNSIELANIQYRQFEENIKAEIPMIEAKKQLESFGKQIETQKQNEKILEREIETGKTEAMDSSVYKPYQ